MPAWVSRASADLERYTCGLVSTMALLVLGMKDGKKTRRENQLQESADFGPGLAHKNTFFHRSCLCSAPVLLRRRLLLLIFFFFFPFYSGARRKRTSSKSWRRSSARNTKGLPSLGLLCLRTNVLLSQCSQGDAQGQDASVEVNTTEEVTKRGRRRTRRRRSKRKVAVWWVYHFILLRVSCPRKLVWIMYNSNDMTDYYNINKILLLWKHKG